MFKTHLCATGVGRYAGSNPRPNRFTGVLQGFSQSW